MNDNLPPLPEPDTLDRGWELSAYSEEQMKDYARAAIELQGVPAGYVPVPNSLIDEFPEINPSNYGHDDACALNRWGCEVVTAAIERQSVPIQCEREAFETWASRQQGFGCAANPVDYTLGATRDAWEVWQARAAIELQSAPATQDAANLLDRFERQWHRMGELWERCQGKGWPEKEGAEFESLRDEKSPATRAALLALLAAAPQPQPVQEPVAWALQFGDDVRICLSTVFDTRDEAQDYASSCIDKTELTPLYTSPQAQAAHGITKGTT